MTQLPNAPDMVHMQGGSHTALEEGVTVPPDIPQAGRVTEAEVGAQR